MYLCQKRTTGVVDIIYVNIVTCSVGFERVGELARVGQLLADQVNCGWVFATTIKKAGSPSK